MKSVDDKYKTVLDKNTYFFFNEKFEQNYEGYINSIKETLILLKDEIDSKGLKKETIENIIKNKANGLRAILALNGFSNEYFLRLITFIRIIDNEELNKLTYKNKWKIKEEKNVENIKEWNNNKIEKLIKEDEYFRKGLINIFYEGASVQYLADKIPLFELKKLSLSKLKFEIPELIDSLVRYKEKGSYSGKKENNPERVIERLLESLDLTYDKGDLKQLIKDAPNIKRTMDFIIPNKNNPKIIIECTYLVTTSSGQGDKSKTEITIKDLIIEHYPKAKFIGFVDGIGWYVRLSDLKRMVSAYSDVFTFHKDEIERFETFLKKEFHKR